MTCGIAQGFFAIISSEESGNDDVLWNVFKINRKLI